MKLPEPRKGLRYTKTNETLGAIKAGLNPQPGDYVVSIGGSLEQALMLSEYVERVLAIDWNEDQIEHMHSVIGLVKRGKYNDFFEARTKGTDGNYGSLYFPHGGDVSEMFNWEMMYGTNYFTLERLDAIRKGLGKIEIRFGDIVEVACTEPDITKVYLSNAPYNVFGSREMVSGRATEILDRIAANLPEGGLIYITGYNEVDFLGDSLEKDLELTRSASIIDRGWKPSVFRKVSGRKDRVTASTVG